MIRIAAQERQDCRRCRPLHRAFLVPESGIIPRTEGVKLQLVESQNAATEMIKKKSRTDFLGDPLCLIGFHLPSSLCVSTR